DPGEPPGAGDGRAPGEDFAAGGRGCCGAVRLHATAASARAGAGHHADGAGILLNRFATLRRSVNASPKRRETEPVTAPRRPRSRCTTRCPATRTPARAGPDRRRTVARPGSPG